VTNKEACLAATKAVLRAFGRIDVLVNNAGITQPAKTLDITGADYDRILDVSLRGSLYMSQAVLPTMQTQKGGSIICISSVSAQRGGGILGGPHYSAAKAGVLGLARAMAREFGPDGIRVNSITPGLIGTDIIKGKLTEETKAEIAETIGRESAGDPVGFARGDRVQNCCRRDGASASARAIPCPGKSLAQHGHSHHAAGGNSVAGHHSRGVLADPDSGADRRGCCSRLAGKAFAYRNGTCLYRLPTTFAPRISSRR